MDKDFWDTVRSAERKEPKSNRTGVLNMALLFGTAAIALSLILTPMLAGGGGNKSLAYTADDFDNITTGSIGNSDGAKRYTIRRSILQETPGSVCIVDSYNGGAGCR
ncbi:hypothetical protein [Ciceribacter sp. L1K22]|uniref:hypothetical protein n=1 Tax=Ciceribacter sp. L1K22 TaxID=2820275 RepID=UPI001ABE1091|nr:hypothetical protein [Ciceribacter sp. L1K22]MBO3762360.1 hypothetical protein [Ciceribacter sp. L1K22]